MDRESGEEKDRLR